MVLAAREFSREHAWAVARRIRKRREDLGLGQREVVDRLKERAGLEVTVGGYSNWERYGISDQGFIEALALALDCKPPYLLGWTNKPGSWRPDRTLEVIVSEHSAPRANLKGKRHLSAIDGGRTGPRDVIQAPLLR